MPHAIPPDLLPAAIGSAILLLIYGCATLWVTMIRRWRRGQSVLSCEPRRRVPWGGFDVALLAVLYLFMPLLVMKTSQGWLDVPVAAAASATNAEEKEPAIDNVHPLARVLLESQGQVWPILLCMLSAIVVAPIAEEFMFRLLLQGWLEAAERRLRKRIPWRRRKIVGLLPVTFVAILFSSVHLREPSPRIELSTIVFLLSVQAVASLVSVALSVCWLKFAAGATLTDFGIAPKRLAGDIRLGLLAFVAVMPPIYAGMFAVKSFFPDVADPVFLLPLAVVLGLLYFRTHRIVPAVALHMAFNAVGVLLALAA